MLSDEFFSPSEITTSNIASLSADEILISERRICEVAELACEAVRFSLELAEVGVDGFDVLSVIADGYPDVDSFVSEDSLKANRRRLEYILSGLSIMDKAHFADIYTELLAKEGRGLNENVFLPEVMEDETFVYVKNAYADEAYDVFSQEFSDPRVRYAGSMREAVKLVSDGVVSYCILPLEERGARLSSVTELLYRSELKINSVIPVFGMDADADIKYALVSRSFYIPKIDKGDDRYLEIRIPTDSDIGLSELLFAAGSYGVNVYRVNTLMFKTMGEQKGYYSVVFCGEDVDFTSLLTFLTLFVPEYTAVGIYKNLEL
ncbi:MAG: hypothetical protein J6B48_01870 [Clostridia bacterium]|nr:hypothetical protein [Clostridia bacterium]